MLSKIPRRLHFIWGLLDDADDIPKVYRSYYEKWIDWHPEWDVQLLGSNEIENIVGKYKHYPYDSYTKAIQRCDVCRPMLLHQMGGIYIDLDVEPHITLDVLLTMYPEANVILAVETVLTEEMCRQIGQNEPIRFGAPELPVRVANYFMASVPRHPFWLAVLELMKQRHHLPIRNEYDILYTTGPDVITEIAYRAAQDYSDVVVVPIHIINQMITHHFVGGWRDKSDRSFNPT